VIKKGESDGCGTWNVGEWGKRNACRVGWGNLKERCDLKDLGTDERITSKWITKK
jgi:hypothetical protein